MSGDIKAQVGRRGEIARRPHRFVFGRRHSLVVARPVGETFMPLGGAPTISKRWFSVEDVVLTRAVTGEQEPAWIRVRCESATNSVQVWDGREPVRLAPGSSYLAQTSTLFVGDLIEGRIWGARIELSPRLPGALGPAWTSRGEALDAITEQPAVLDLSATTRDVLLARYHRYYRHPPQFNPQPIPWADVAVVLGLLELRDARDDKVIRRVVRPPQDAVSAVKRQIERLHPGWLPTSSETEKTFHDHLRTILEMEGVFDAHVLIGFDAAFPRALAIGNPAAIAHGT